MTEVKLLYKAINAIQKDLALVGIGKTQDVKTNQGNYKARGIDDIYNTLGALLPKHNVNIFPSYLDRQLVERQSKSGNTIFYVTLKSQYKFVCSEDGSSETVDVISEAMDTGDKATNKAMSIAYKYACMQVFCIPVEGEGDGEKQTYELAYDGHIDPDHAEIIENLINETKSDRAKFMEFMKVSDITEIRASDYSKAIRMLNRKKEKA